MDGGFPARARRGRAAREEAAEAATPSSAEEAPAYAMPRFSICESTPAIYVHLVLCLSCHWEQSVMLLTEGVRHGPLGQC